MANKSSAFGLVFSVLCPFIVLLTATFLASALAYIAVSVFGDAISFRTVLKKSMQFFLVLSIFPLMSWLKFNKTDLGFVGYPLFFRQISQGIGIGIVTLLPVLAVLYGLGVHVIDGSKPWTPVWLGKRLALDYLLAMLIAIVEEPLFRGILFTGLSQKMPVTRAIAISAFYYAGLHFVNSNIEIPAQNAGLFSGFILLGDAFGNVFNWHYLSPFIALYVVGVVLGLLRAYVKTGLGICIGCHAAWVWQIKLSKSFFNVDLNSPYLFLVSGYDGVIGPFVTVWLVLSIAGYFGYQRYRKLS